MRYLNRILSKSHAIALLLLVVPALAVPAVAFSQDEGLTFEQAQTRTTHARRQMATTRRALAEAEAREEESLGKLPVLRKRLEEARLEAERATQMRESAQKAHAQAQERWSVESERLKRIHRQRDAK